MRLSTGPWEQGTKGREHPHQPCWPHLGLLQAVVDQPEVLVEEVLADGLPIDADPLTHLHEVRGAGDTEQGEELGTAPPALQNSPDSPAHL